MEVTTQQRQEILEDAVNRYIQEGYQLVKKENNRAYLKRRIPMPKGSLLRIILGDVEKVFLYVEASGEISVSHI